MYRYSAFQQGIQRLAMTRWGAWVCARMLPRLDAPVIRWSGGRFSFTSILAGLPIIRLTTLGAKSGLPRTVSLLSIPYESNFIIVASNFGQRHFPAWIYNLRAHPEAAMELKGVEHICKATEVGGEEWQRCFEVAASIYPGYRLYKERAGRKIPVFVLSIASPA